MGAKSDAELASLLLVGLVYFDGQSLTLPRPLFPTSSADTRMYDLGCRK